MVARENNCGKGVIFLQKTQDSRHHIIKILFINYKISLGMSKILFCKET